MEVCFGRGHTLTHTPTHGRGTLKTPHRTKRVVRLTYAIDTLSERTRTNSRVSKFQQSLAPYYQLFGQR